MRLRSRRLRRKIGLLGLGAVPMLMGLVLLIDAGRRSSRGTVLQPPGPEEIPKSGLKGVPMDQQLFWIEAVMGSLMVIASIMIFATLIKRKPR